MSLFSENLKIHLNEDQKQAVEHFKGPALVLAIPGSGKTTMLMYRTLNLIETYKVPPHRILSLTFSKAAALDMSKRMNDLFPNAPYKIGFSTIHRFCYSVLLSYFKTIDRTYTLLEDANAPITKQQLLRKIYHEINHEFLTEDIYEELNTAISYVKNMDLQPENHEVPSVRRFSLIVSKYDAYKKENFLMDFDDMLTMCKLLFEAKPHILKHYQEKFDFIQLDESQDTSKVQHQIIEMLAQQHQNIFMVADDDQSIYGFRGADPNSILTLHKKYPELKEYQLKINYRSSEEIIRLCEHIITNNHKRKRKVFESFHTSSGNMQYIQLDTTENQCDFILNEHLKNDDVKAVLFRNNLSMLPLVDHLDRSDVDFSVKESNLSFFNHWTVLDMMAFMKLSMVPNDLSSFERIYYKMNAFISKNEMNYIKDHYRGSSVLDSLVDLPEIENFKRTNLRKIKSYFQQLGTMSPDLVIEFIEDELNYRQYMTDYLKKHQMHKDSSNKYLDILKYIAKHTQSISDFLDRMDQLKNTLYKARKNNNPFALHLMTMHASKGLEFDHVFLIDIDHQLFPSKSAVDAFEDNNSEPLEEERRLFYVALSRAKKGITIVHTKFKNGQYNKASQFITEYQKHHTVEQIQETSKKDAEMNLAGFKVNDKVLHTSFGVGTLIDIDGDRIMIEFKDATKTLSAALCNDNKILIKID
ncbi:MAG: ATP-dependent helicase [Clostridia bacterium]|nr:ATP-dependent helicase [Clostridia bacterium]